MITLATLPQATAQQVYDQVKEHLLTQMKKSTKGHVYGVTMAPGEVVKKSVPVCSYRGDGDLKCAAGCLISDAEYAPQMEGKSWRSLVSNTPISLNHELLITELQNVHDDHDPEEWAQQLKDLALKHNLIP